MYASTVSSTVEIYRIICMVNLTKNIQIIDFYRMCRLQYVALKSYQKLKKYTLSQIKFTTLYSQILKYYILSLLY